MICHNANGYLCKITMTILSKINFNNIYYTREELVYYFNPSIFGDSHSRKEIYLTECKVPIEKLSSSKTYKIETCKEVASVVITDSEGNVYTYIILSIDDRMVNSDGTPYIIWLDKKETSHLKKIQNIICLYLLNDKSTSSLNLNFNENENVKINWFDEPRSWPVILRPKQKVQKAYTDMDGVVIGLNIPKNAPDGVRNMDCARTAKLTLFGFVMLLGFPKIQIITNRRGEAVEKKLENTLRKSIQDDFKNKGKQIGLFDVNINIDFSFEITHGPEKKWRAIQPVKGISKATRLYDLSGNLKDASFSEDQPHVVKELLKNGVKTVIHVHRNGESYSIIHSCNSEKIYNSDKENILNEVLNNVVINDTA